MPSPSIKPLEKITLNKMLQDMSEEYEGCIAWKGRRTEFGHGQFRFAGSIWFAHRAAWVCSNGDIPKGMQVLHKCDNPWCIKLEHLFLGTQADNIADAIAKGRFYKHPRRISEEQRKDIRDAVAGGATYDELALKYNVSKQTIFRYYHGITPNASA
ncbi:MAG: HNH endonuclease [Patescibacteria group bacterium]|nr:HNH endonuclease [Patescibacteria group bacterium]